MVSAVQRRGAGGFSLVELLVTAGILMLLFLITFTAVTHAKDASNRAKCASNLRQIATAYHLFAADHNRNLPSKAMLGNSSYRQIDDPLGMPAHLEPYIAKDSVWLCPAGRKTLKQYGVNYAWSRATNLAGDLGSAGAYGNAQTATILWDNFSYALPSVRGVPEAVSSGGPTVVTALLRYYPHNRKTDAHYLQLDGHVELK